MNLRFYCEKCEDVSEAAASVTEAPTPVPTAAPTAVPTTAPDAVPATPTATPTPVPTAVPTATPTAAPTAEPTPAPTGVPTASQDEEEEAKVADDLPSQCWKRLPTGCDKTFKDTKTPTKWFVDTKSKSAKLCKSRIKSYNNWCNRT